MHHKLVQQDRHQNKDNDEEATIYGRGAMHYCLCHQYLELEDVKRKDTEEIYVEYKAKKSKLGQLCFASSMILIIWDG